MKALQKEHQNYGDGYIKNQEKELLQHLVIVQTKCLQGGFGKLIEKIKPDLIISAHPFSTQMCGILKKKGKLKLEVSTIMTDFKYHEQWLEKHEYLEKFFVSNDKMRNDLITYGLEENRVFSMRNTYIPKVSRKI